MTPGDSEHPCDGVWLDVDAALGMTADDAVLDVDVLSEAGVVGLVGSPRALSSVGDPGELGTFCTGVHHGQVDPDLMLVDSDDPARLVTLGRWAERHERQLVVDAHLLRALDGDPFSGPWPERCVAGLLVHDPHDEALELVRGDDSLAGFHGTLEFASAFRGGAASLLGPLPFVGPGWIGTLLARCEGRASEALDAERRLARWIETSVLPAARALGAERSDLPLLLAEIAGWLEPAHPRLGGHQAELRDTLAQLGQDLGLPEDPLDPL